MAADLEVHLAPSSYLEALRHDVRAGLTTEPKTLPPKYFYDARGSELFDEITRLPEYYPTRAESTILHEHADEIATLSQARTLVELGSGTSAKTRLLLRALTRAGTLHRFVPFDVDPVVLTDAAKTISTDFPLLSVEPVVGDFEEHLTLLPGGDRQLIAFLGSTIGNLEPVARGRFLRDVSSVLRPGDTFLLGTDLVKDVGRLQRAYDDSAGVTAEFNRNVLTVVNRELGADFDVTAFEHVAVWDAEHEWIEMRLRSSRDQVVHIADLDLDVRFAAGEEMRTEISAKFHPDGIADELGRVRLRVVRFWTDPDGDFGLSLATPMQ
ncbi:MAG: L-histidine Nalpha-methyltransferase [Pseudonocardiales bacterium]|jgi:L-histidine N-alpha-methyltransferase|nr:L-histidine Nalpha-methyltransferase [Pseudonocardiales bacterium]MDT4963981.1 L-histidine Nalpha-methyltransferase [Pseudonocardiales bacterium]MDT4971328.1 L-histidine Nalpha-methyltransferase [Pseudonocardiales bacterium]MDT4982346.1 L-histidine Nalpha-methyltransferase [Pseudonocardiales bacterium]MDT4983812.1 L-histidine Nalpha-methyltransferase [Pseudonocardiales bacterium]